MWPRNDGERNGLLCGTGRVVARKLAVILHRMWVDGNEQDCRVARIGDHRVPATRREKSSLPDGGGGEIVSFFACARTERPRLQH